jgi:hypothetical protein
MHEKGRVSKKIALSENALGWIAVALVLIAAIIVDKNSPNKWHAAIMWTSVAFLGVLIWGRQKRNSWLFWVFWAACLLLHVSVMWVISASFYRV